MNRDTGWPEVVAFGIVCATVVAVVWILAG